MLSQGTSKGFLLRLLEYAEIDIYMPNQVIIPRGDYVHELNIMLTGQAFCSKGGSRKKPENNILIGTNVPWVVRIICK